MPWKKRSKVRKDLKVAQDTLDADHYGLEKVKQRILEVIISKFSGGPVGIKTLAVAVGEEPDTLEEVYEPFLVREGYLERTLKGRRSTLRAYQHLGLEPPPAAGDGQNRLL
ncbi:MAG: Holliday junction ATP-dependent DNA helicase RuvB [candidate division TA06 bacterium ADurb.Bin417]|uniref:Holliday junction ATP-dependent DNA helicase RuvB n=1 Tax=candidate division TA06 bacterium ADurb.Bin417 TaxID=1852828 RepID=A0A1V5MID6_UNCT6|nr:MAG: Holliday junction ATP-dependent DNA helicase RuvB [candidate division TA06 bacterium ADurb.Bin417]